MSRDPYDPEQHKISVLEEISEALARIADSMEQGLNTEKLERVLRDHHRLVTGHADRACGDTECAEDIASEYARLGRNPS